ncbi:DNA primase [Allopusillimonas soli]|uniref:DNA primase n=1 Tax=Allopusillimonas soli TaxID=659016 RepID=A0A853FBF8_9BURK|nr:DNA primase [Allopusillimonas soli]NYT36972.1 DNA primase [Allopusillimonas soli]TEA75420.1 DNA primase [Allopusillimonas soli]
MIPESFVQELLARVDVVDVVGRYVQLRKGGANLLGLCPFHNEKSPSFTVSPTKQFYHCFGCGAHGSAITFLMEHTGASFPEAVRTLASSVGLAVPETPRSPRQREADKRQKEEISRHQQVLDMAQAHYTDALKRSQPAIHYLKQRGLSGETAARFGLGWSGNDRRGLASVFPHYEDAVLVESGLVIEAEDGRRYDRFRERVMFPIRNTRGKLIGFGGRIIGKGEPKYLNSPETTLFSKGHELYGLWEARAGIRSEGHVLVVEGYMDVVGLAQHGLGNAVATLGTSTTPHHIQKLLRASNRIVFSFDGDKAGRRAAWRALTTCLPLVRDDISMRFLFLPAEHDPDSYIRNFGAEAFRATVSEAMPLSRFMLEELASRHAMDEAEGRAACVHEAKPLLALLPEGTLRLQIEREFARMVMLTPEELAAMLEASPVQAEPLQIHPPSQGIVPSDIGRGGIAPVSRSEPVSREAGMPPAYLDEGLDALVSGHGQWAADSILPGYSEESSQAAPYHGSPGAHNPGTGRYTGRGRPTRGARTVTPLAKRLLRLLLAHPQIVDALGDQQLEILQQGPHLVLVRDLITLANMSGARHAGALLQAADPGSALADVLASLTPELLAEEELPDPQAEWNDALLRMELAAIRAEQSALVESGLKDEFSRRRYQELTRRITLLNTNVPTQ